MMKEQFLFPQTSISLGIRINHVFNFKQFAVPCSTNDKVVLCNSLQCINGS